MNHIFGPVNSRRLGRSLGIDLLPRKICNYDCIYCEVGATTNLTCERKEYVPTEDIITYFPWWRKILGKLMLKRMEGKFNLEEGYNINAAREIKPVVGDIPLIVVGGMRRVSHMEEVIENGYADFISMSRPFIKEPNIVNKFIDGKAASVSCVSCNRCFAGVANYYPVACYNKGFPKK